jgi:hypothetical protein
LESFGSCGNRDVARDGMALPAENAVGGGAVVGYTTRESAHSAGRDLPQPSRPTQHWLAELVNIREDESVSNLGKAR